MSYGPDKVKFGLNNKSLFDASIGGLSISLD
jgi:hypothetical protein